MPDFIAITPKDLDRAIRNATASLHETIAGAIADASENSASFISSAADPESIVALLAADDRTDDDLREIIGRIEAHMRGVPYHVADLP